jgi:hypothetical protein
LADAIGLFDAPSLVCVLYVELSDSLLFVQWAQIGRGGDGEVAADEGRDDFDEAFGDIGLAFEDGADGVAEVQVAVVGILEFLDGEVPARSH